VLAGVHFMAETASCSTGRTVLIPDSRPAAAWPSRSPGRCAPVGERYPGAGVTYVNTSAEVKAESDICCTSPTRSRCGVAGTRGHLLPTSTGPLRRLADQRRGDPLAGHCMVHELFTPTRCVASGRLRGKLECSPTRVPPEVLAEADFVGSTAGMVRHVGSAAAPPVLVTECSMSNVAVTSRPRVCAPCGLPPHAAHHLRGSWTPRLPAPSGGAGPTWRPAPAGVERMLAVGRAVGLRGDGVAAFDQLIGRCVVVGSGIGGSPRPGHGPSVVVVTKGTGGGSTPGAGRHCRGGGSRRSRPSTATRWRWGWHQRPRAVDVLTDAARSGWPPGGLGVRFDTGSDGACS